MQILQIMGPLRSSRMYPQASFTCVLSGTSDPSYKGLANFAFAFPWQGPIISIEIIHKLSGEGTSSEEHARLGLRA